MAAGAALAWLAIRCTPFGALPADADGGHTPPPEADASAEPDREGGRAGDAAPPGEAGTCGTGYTICDDFERTSALGGPFQWRVGVGSNADAITSPLSATGRTLLFRMPAGEEAYLETDLPPRIRRLRIGFRMRIEAGMPLTQLMSVAFADGHYAILEVVDEEFHLGEQDSRPEPDINHISWLRPATAGWARYELDVDIANQLITLHRGGAKLGDKVITLALLVPTLLRIGITYNETLGRSYDVEFDDVGVAVEP